MTSGPLFDAEGSIVDARLEAEPRDELADEIDGWSNTDAGGQAQQERVVVIRQFARQGIRVVHPLRVQIHGPVLTKLPRHDDAQ